MKGIIDHTSTGTDYHEDDERMILVMAFLSERLLGAKEGTFLEFLRDMKYPNAQNGCKK